MLNRIYFQTTKFVDINVPDLDAVEVHYGYRIFADFMQAYNNSMTADELQKLTPERVLALIKNEDATDNGTGLLDSVVMNGGFFFNDERIEVERVDGEVQIKK